jgi:hypothetical protein
LGYSTRLPFGYGSPALRCIAELHSARVENTRILERFEPSRLKIGDTAD